jgi:hypothetical protein
MAMTKADFQAMAEAISDAKDDTEYSMPDGTPEEREAALKALQFAAERLATACRGQYKGGYGFDRAKFLDVCGFGPANGN